MMAPGFKPVGWVAAVAVAAIGCYMLSLNVASERAELARVEHQIVATKQQIRALQTELGTRGRLAQLEQWNSEVLALSAPTSAQFLGNEMMLARFDRGAPSIEERAAVRMASVETGSVVGANEVEAPVVHAAAPADAAPRPTAALATPQLVRKASLELPAAPTPGSPSIGLSTKQKRSDKDSGIAAPRPAPPKSAPPKPVLRTASAPAPAASKPALKSPDRPKPIVLASTKATKPAAPVAARSKDKPKSGSRIGDSLAKEIGAAAKAEARAGGR
jgi:hypothetical protein